jgi:hypothetical protein
MNLSDQEKLFVTQGHFSLAIQQLLLLIDQNIDREDSDDFSTLVCDFLHQVFIEHPECIRLVHFQGYSLRILPIVIKKVPSLRILD